MDKELLFQFARAKFQEAEFTAAEIDLHIQSLQERYSDMTPDEIEADVKGRGGPTGFVNSMIEKRNALLLADEEYRAFADRGEMPAEATVSDPEAPLTQESSAGEAQEPSVAYALSETPTEQAGEEQPAEQEAPENTDIPDTTAAQGEASPAASDPFANWFFTDTEETDAPAQKPSAEAVRSVGAPTGTVDAVPMPQPVHTSAQSHPPVREADMSRTRVISMPTSEQIPVHPRPHPAQVPHSDGSRSTEQYRQEQSAIWGASSVTDPSGRPNRQSPAGYQTGRTSSKKTRDLQQAASRTPNKREKKEYEDYGNVTWLQSKTYWGEGSAEGVRRFRLIFWISLPFVIALLLAYAAVAIGLIAGMALLVACAVAALVAWVAVGALVALIGIIYGVSQIFLVMPIGLFELGIGVATIGVTMLVGILLYNFAVRLLPYLIRKFIVLQGTLKLFLVDLYYYVKGECYRR